VLTVSGYDFQANEVDTKALQYWGDINSDGTVEIPRVKAGNYRLTVYADGEL
jgi:rhamnogalacturonan endolyase